MYGAPGYAYLFIFFPILFPLVPDETIIMLSRKICDRHLACWTVMDKDVNTGTGWMAAERETWERMKTSDKVPVVVVKRQGWWG